MVLSGKIKNLSDLDFADDLALIDHSCRSIQNLTNDLKEPASLDVFHISCSCLSRIFNKSNQQQRHLAKGKF